jgi:hypothetical protein
MAFETMKRHAPAMCPACDERRAVTAVGNNAPGFTHRTRFQP